MKWLVVLLMACFAGCKAPYEFADRSAYVSDVDSSRVRSEYREAEGDFLRILQSGLKVEVVIEHYALLPDSLKCGRAVTYLAKKEVYRGEATEDLQEGGHERRAEVLNDSTGMKSKSDVHADMSGELKRRGVGTGWVSVIVLGVLAGSYCLRRYLRW